VSNSVIFGKMKKLEKQAKKNFLKKLDIDF